MRDEKTSASKSPANSDSGQSVSTSSAADGDQPDGMAALAQLAQRRDRTRARHEAAPDVVEPDRADLLHHARRHARLGEHGAHGREVAVRLRGTNGRGSRGPAQRVDLVDHARGRLLVPVDQRLPEVEDHRCARPQHLPGAPDVVLGRARVADREPDRVLAAQPGRRDEELARSRSRRARARSCRCPRAGSTRSRTGAARPPPTRARPRPTTRTAARGARARGSSACSPSAPYIRSTNQSLSARKRRPSAGPKSFRSTASAGRGEVVGRRRERRLEHVRAGASRTPSSPSA